MKRLLTTLLLTTISYSGVFAAGPAINCGGLPGCSDTNSTKGPIEAIVTLVGLLIQYVAVIAVIALMMSGIMYLVSGGEEEKVKKAKMWIMWSLIGVILSVSAWTIITVINNITITL